MAAFVAAYLVLRTVASIAETQYVAGTGFSPWHLMSGLDVIFFLVCGWRWWPLPVVAAMARTLLFPAGLHASLGVNFVAITMAEAVLALATKVAVDYFRVQFPLRTLRDVGGFVGVLGFGAPLIIGVIGVAIFTLTGRFLPSDAPVQFARFVAGDVTSIVVFVPTIAYLLTWNASSGQRDERLPANPLDLWIGLGATFAVVVAECAIGARIGRPVVELSFVPLAWLAIRHGMRGAVLGILVFDVTSAIAHAAFAIPILTQVEYQGYLVATVLMSLLLAVTTGERNRLLDRLERGANFDELTSLPNRERLVAWINRHRNVPLVLVMLDIDDMRLFNEGVGRIAADRVLQEFATRLRVGLPASYFVARVSSDEFAVAIVDERSPHAVIGEIRQLLEAPFDIDGSRLYVAASAGAVQMARSAEVDEVLRRADLALHRAKTAPNRTTIYTPELQGASLPLLVVELHRAVERREFVPFFQPIFRFEGGRWQLAGAEALLRWVHPQRGVVGPDQFIDLLGRLSIGDHVGWRVMEESLRAGNTWRRQVPGFRVWVNLFARQALDPNCVRRIRELLATTQASPDSLVVEITERVVVSEEQDISSLAQELRAVGVTTAIDDFGTGGSSLGRVRDVPVQVLKIDRSFVTRCEIDAKAKAVAAAVVRLASELGMAVVAEGVENALQIDAMIEIGCEYAQGYALGHPVPADLFERMVTEAAAV